MVTIIYFVAVICRGYHGQESADSGAGANLRASPNAHVQQPISSAHTVSIACTCSNIHPHHQELCSWHHEGDKGKHLIYVSCQHFCSPGIESAYIVVILNDMQALFENSKNL